MRIEVISVGTELLVGSILNTNQQFLASTCAKEGWDLYHLSTVGDNPERLCEAMHLALKRSDLVITTGGLGPTEDDLTLASIARAFNWRLVHDSRIKRAMRHITRQKRIPLSKRVLNQALVPQGAKVFLNHFGTAPGVLKEVNYGTLSKRMLLLPGPPGELRPMFQNQVIPALRRIFKDHKRFFLTRRLIFPAAQEHAIAERARDLLTQPPPVTIGIYAHPGDVELRVMAKCSSQGKANQLLDLAERRIRQRFKNRLIIRHPDSLWSSLCKTLKSKRRTLAVAESCTGGLLGDCVTSTPGSSQVFLGGLICYDSRIKEHLLGVTPATLKRHGAVSRQTVRAMTQGLRRLFPAHYTIAISGIAGPGGGSSRKPVGLVYIAVAGGKRCIVTRKFFLGGRADIKIKSVNAAATLLIQNLAQL